ncbi:MAG: SPOR domain-containing protein [Saprospiraceae bacterium]
MEPITENIVKKIALRFFRHHYKYRLRYEDQPVVAKYDLDAAGGIIADGYYSFKNPDGTKFTATFEATGKESKDEVTYKPQKKILFWDGLAVACIFTVFIFALNYAYHFHTLDQRTLLSRIGLVVLTMGVGFGIFYLIAQQFRRYRYIYAIEQFKKYHADEQWIALAYNVFEDPNDKYFKELKNQCVYNGFGLLVVDKKLDPKILITPSRQDIFSGKRQSVEFSDSHNLPQPAPGRGLTPWWTQLGLELPKVLKKDTSLLRYRRSFYHQIAISSICAFLLGIIFWKEMNNAGYQRVDKNEYREGFAKSRSNNVLEQEDYLGDSSTTPLPNYKKDKFWLTEKGESPATTTEQKPVNNGPCEALVSRGDASIIHYPCERFLNFDGEKFVVQEGTYTTKEEAEAALLRLKTTGINATALPLSFLDGSPGYIVFADLIYNSRKEAQQRIKKLARNERLKQKQWTIQVLSLAQK